MSFFDVKQTVIRGDTYDVITKKDVVALLIEGYVPNTYLIVAQERAGAKLSPLMPGLVRGSIIYEILAGHVEPGGDPLATILREAVEELGSTIHLIPSRVVYLGGVFLSPGWTTEFVSLFYYRLSSPEENIIRAKIAMISSTTGTEDELIQLHIVPIEQCEVLCFDAKFYSALYKKSALKIG